MKAILFVTSLIVSAPSASDTFAIVCNGETFSTSVKNGEVVKEKYILPDQIFVFSESSEVALRAMPIGKAFENLCEIESSGKELNFSPDKIRVYWISPSDWDAITTCEFKFDRANSVATMRTKFEWSAVHHRESEWRMDCTPTQIPVYDLEER